MFVCILIPDFPVQSILRLETESTRSKLNQSPIAILDGPASIPRVMASNTAARQAGIEIGMTKLQAEVCAGIVMRKRSIASEDTAHAALLDCAYGFSPRVEFTHPGTVIADLAGTEKLFGTTADAAGKIDARIREFGFEASIAVAADPDTAFYAARGFTGITIIPAGFEAEQLAALPVHVLSASPEVLEALDAWGIRNFGDLAALPSIALVERLGQEGLHLKKLARGEIKRLLIPAELSQDFIESFEFEDPVETLESLTFILNRLLQQVCSRLRSRALATNEVRLRLELEARQLQGEQQKESYERAWKLPLPVQDHKTLFRLACLDLESNTQSAPIQKLIIEAIPVRPRFAQAGLFAPAAPESEQLEITLARIRGVVGGTDENGIACVGSPRVLDSHKPDSFTVEPFSTLAEETDNHDAAPIAAMRMFRPPLPALVKVVEEKPCALIFAKKRMRVLAAHGPWRGSGHWWSESGAWVRDEWDVELKTREGTGVYRIYLDRVRGEWFVDGRLD